MKLICLSIFLTCLAAVVVTGQSIGDFRSHGSGNWNSTITWEQWDGSAWITPASVVPNSNSNQVVARTGHVITITANVTVDQMTVEPGASVNINSGRTLTVSDNGTPDSDLTVSGTLDISGTLATTMGTTTVASGGILVREQGSSLTSFLLTLILQAGGVMEHRFVSPAVALAGATYDPASTLIINGLTGSGTFSSSSWSTPLGNVIYQCPLQGSGTVSFAGLLNHLSGDLIIRNTGTGGRLLLNDPQTMVSQNFHIGRLEVAAGSQLVGAGDIIIDRGIENDGTIDLTKGLLTLDGSGTIDGPGTNNFFGFTVGSGAGVVANSSLNITGVLTVTTESQLTVNEIVNVSSDLFISGELQSNSWVNFIKTASITGFGSKAFKNMRIGEGVILTTSLSLRLGGILLNDGILHFDAGTVSFVGDSTVLTGSSKSTTFFAVRVDSAASFQSQITLRINGTLTVSGSGNFRADSNSDVYVFGNFSVTGAFASAGIVYFPDSTTMTGVGSRNFNDINIAGVLVSNSDYTISGNIDLVGSGSLQNGNGITTTIAGNCILSNKGFGMVTFYNITIASSLFPYSLATASPITIVGATVRCNNGNLISTAETTFSRIGTTRITGSGSVVLNSFVVGTGTTFRPNVPFSVIGDIQVYGSLIAGNTVTFAGETDLMGNGTATISFTNIAIARGSRLVSHDNLVSVNGNFNNEGDFIAGEGTIVFAGNTLKKVTSNKRITFRNIVVNNGSVAVDVSLENSVNLAGVLSLTEDAHIDVDGSMDTAVFTLLSEGDNPTRDASIAEMPMDAVVDGDLTVQRYLSLEGISNNRLYRYVSSPVSNGSVSDLQQEIPVTGLFAGCSFCQGCGSQPSMFWYDESVVSPLAEDGYSPFPIHSNAETLLPGRGYALFIRGNIEPVLSAGSARYDMRGPINTGTIDYHVSFTNSGSTSADGWNLVGNPYPSSINWNSPGWTRDKIAGTIYRIDNGSNPSRYVTWNGTVGTNGGTSLIASGQGFFIQATGDSPALFSDERVKTAGVETNYFRTSQPSNLLRILMSQKDLRDEAVIHFRDDATREFDFKVDAIKLENRSSGNVSGPYFNLSSLSENRLKLAINSLPPTFPTSLSLDISDVPRGTYSLEFAGMESFPVDLRMILFDRFDNADSVNLREQSNYPFQVTEDSMSFGSNRFQIFFERETQVFPVTVGLKWESDSTRLWPNPVSEILQLQLGDRSNVSTEIMVINSQGQVVGTFPLTIVGEKVSWQYDFTNIPPGIYFIRIARSEGNSMLRVMKE